MAMRQCIFCGNSGSGVKITRQHAFPRWLDDVLTPEVIGTGLSYERTFVSPGEDQRVNSWPVEITAAIEVPVVCNTCNGGWMGNLEGIVKPLLEPMILGKPSSLTVQQQLIVATWATMKVMVFEFAWGQPPVSTQGDRDIVYNLGHPPASAQVRIAAVELAGLPVMELHRVYVRGAPPPTDPGPQDLAFVVTLVLGTLLIQVSGGPAAGYAGFERYSTPTPTILPIFLPLLGPATWPPAQTLDHEGLHAFAHPWGVAMAPPIGDAPVPNC